MERQVLRTPQEGRAREALEERYRRIAIPAVAAAASLVRREPETRRHAVPEHLLRLQDMAQD